MLPARLPQSPALIAHTDFGGGSMRSTVLAATMRYSARYVVEAWERAPDMPWPYGLVDQVGRLQRCVRETTFEHVQLPQCGAEIVRTPATEDSRWLVYLHGGGFLVGGRHLHRAFVSRLAEATRSSVIVPDYRKLPHHPISAAVDDGVDAYLHVLDSAPADKVALVGDSAGGFIAFMVADAIAAAQIPAPAAIVAMSPLVDLGLSQPHPDRNQHGCALLSPRSIPTLARMAALRSGAERLRSPVDCNPTDLPPTLIQVSTSETLFGQVHRLARRLADAGVEVELQTWNHQVHVFQVARSLPEARQAVANIAAFVTRTTTRAATATLAQEA